MIVSLAQCEVLQRFADRPASPWSERTRQPAALVARPAGGVACKFPRRATADPLRFTLKPMV